jgi:hypothetical protein
LKNWDWSIDATKIIQLSNEGRLRTLPPNTLPKESAHHWVVSTTGIQLRDSSIPPKYWIPRVRANVIGEYEKQINLQNSSAFAFIFLPDDGVNEVSQTILLNQIFVKQPGKFFGELRNTEPFPYTGEVAGVLPNVILAVFGYELIALRPEDVEKLFGGALSAFLVSGFDPMPPSVTLPLFDVSVSHIV